MLPWRLRQHRSGAVSPLGHSPMAQKDLSRVQQLREGDVRTLHSLQLKAQSALLAQTSTNPVVNWLLPKILPLLVHSPLLPRVQRRVFVGAPLPPLDPAFSFRA